MYDDDDNLIEPSLLSWGACFMNGLNDDDGYSMCLKLYPFNDEYNWSYWFRISASIDGKADHFYPTNWF